jgi:benzodiazapine receptor
MFKDIIKTPEDSFRLFYAMVVGFIVSMNCKMGKDSGKSVKFRPPSYIFGIVWPILYILLGLSWINSSRVIKDKKIDFLFFIVSSLLAIWIVVYSCMKDKHNSVFVLLATLLALVVLMILIPEKSRLLLAPLMVWVFFAMLLNTSEVQSL